MDVPTYMNKTEQSSKGVRLSINEEYLTNKELELEAILDDINSLTNSDQGALDDVYNRLSVLLRDSAQKNIKRRNVKKGRFRARRNQPWWNRDLWKMKNEFKKAERVWLQSKNKAKRRTLRGVYILKRKAYSKATRQEKRKFNADREAYIERQLHSNPQKLYKELRKVGITGKGHRSLPNEVKKEDGSIVSGRAKVEDTWRKYFDKLLNMNDQTPQEREQGSRSIPSQDCEQASVYAKTELIPTQWRIGTIVPIPKACTKDPLDPSQYRGITVLLVVYKALCKILGNRLVGVIEGEKLLSDEQNGFRGCIDHVLALSLLSEMRLKDKKDTFLCFIDLKKAYDSVDRNLLWKKIGAKRYPRQLLRHAEGDIPMPGQSR